MFNPTCAPVVVVLLLNNLLTSTKINPFIKGFIKDMSHIFCVLSKLGPGILGPNKFGHSKLPPTNLAP